MAHRLADVVRTEIKSRYLAGESSLTIAKAMNCSVSGVLRILKEQGVNPSTLVATRPRAKQKLFADVQDKIIARYKAGDSLSVIAKSHGVVLQTVRFVLMKHGVERRRKGNTYTRVEPDTIREMKRLWGTGVSQTEIARRFKLTQSNVSLIFKNAGIVAENRRAKRERHGGWKGGRGRHGEGYIYVRMERDDPLWEMANVGGYVLEHRLVIARGLGRPLHKWETVHHIDGNKENNTPNNLQLRIGQHGASVVYECACCGSRKLTAVVLS